MISKNGESAREKKEEKEKNNMYSISVSAINFHWIFSGNCRNLAFPSFFLFANKRLMNHNITTVRVPDMDVCELLCYHDPNCVSVNFKSTSSSDGKYKCELNNATHQGRDDQFKDEKGYFYHGADVSISSKLLLLLLLLRFPKFLLPHLDMFYHDFISQILSVVSVRYRDT